jgi:hypothetical protein
MSADVEVVIDELVMRGLEPWEARSAAAALESRLAMLVAGPGRPPRERADASRRLPAVEVPVDSPEALGDAVAGAVWSALSPGGSP